MREMRFSMKVWDAPVRLFHWAIVLLVLACWLTQREGWMQYHFYAGYAIAALLLFRLVWGIVGSDTARFARFLASPLAALRHLAHLPRRRALFWSCLRPLPIFGSGLARTGAPGDDGAESVVVV